MAKQVLSHYQNLIVNSNVAAYMENIQKSAVFPYTIYKQLENAIKT